MVIYQVDAFTDKIFRGNPAGVCILKEQADEKWMQEVAMEMNLSETAFLQKQGDGFHLRWFTPETEVDLCGHATLASSHILWETGVLQMDQEAVFHTKSGRISAKKDRDYIVLNFPLEEEHPVETPDILKLSLKVPILYTGKNRMDYLVLVDDESTVRSLQPELEILKNLGTRGVIVTSCSNNPEVDFVSRYFAPGAGIPEDPVTGSAHCCLGPFWSKRLGKNKMNALQVSKRGGTLKVTIDSDRAYIAGKAVTVFRADMR